MVASSLSHDPRVTQRLLQDYSKLSKFTTNKSLNSLKTTAKIGGLPLTMDDTTCGYMLSIDSGFKTWTSVRTAGRGGLLGQTYSMLPEHEAEATRSIFTSSCPDRMPVQCRVTSFNMGFMIKN